MAKIKSLPILNEAGRAKLCFAPSGNCFQGLLLNELGETFAIEGTVVEEQEVMLANGLAQEFYYNVVVTDTQTGNQYCLKAVRLDRSADGLFCLSSDSLQFQADQVLHGSTANGDANKDFCALFVGNGSPVYLGNLAVDFHASLTPPPTPTSLVDCSEEHMDEDFSR